MMETENIHKDIQLLFAFLGIGRRMAKCEIWGFDSSDDEACVLWCVTV